VRTAISPDSLWIVTADDDLEYEPKKGRTCRLWDLTSADVASSSVLLPADDEGIARVQFSPDGRWLIIDGHADGVELWHMGIDALLDLAARVAGRPLNADEQVVLGQEQ
jgi:WD40 repeat protein